MRFVCAAVNMKNISKLQLYIVVTGNELLSLMSNVPLHLRVHQMMMLDDCTKCVLETEVKEQLICLCFERESFPFFSEETYFN